MMNFDEFKEIIEAHEKQPYPITITQARYGGTYEGDAWLAFNNYAQDVPWPAFADDVTCAEWWAQPINMRFVGRGHTPNEALKDLIFRLC